MIPMKDCLFEGEHPKSFTATGPAENAGHEQTAQSSWRNGAFYVPTPKTLLKARISWVPLLPPSKLRGNFGG